MKRNMIITFLFTLVALFFQNCSVMLDPLQEPTETDLQSMSIETNAMKVIQNRCVTCHNSSLAEGGIDFLGDVNSLLYYRMVVPRDPGSSILYQVIQEGLMPPNQVLSKEEIQTISQWINEGFNGESPVVTAPTVNSGLEPKFSNILTNIFNVKCLSCHSAAKSFGGVNLSSYATVMNLVIPGSPDSSVLYTALVSGKMVGKASAAEAGVIRDWIAKGAPKD